MALIVKATSCHHNWSHVEFFSTVGRISWKFAPQIDLINIILLVIQKNMCIVLHFSLHGKNMGVPVGRSLFFFVMWAVKHMVSDY